MVTPVLSSGVCASSVKESVLGNLPIHDVKNLTLCTGASLDLLVPVTS